jgi:hypothetical protein
MGNQNSITCSFLEVVEFNHSGLTLGAITLNSDENLQKKSQMVPRDGSVQP